MAEKKKHVHVPVVLVGKPWDEAEVRVGINDPQVLVGTPWTDDEVLRARHSIASRRTTVATGLSVFLAVLTVALAAYAVISGDAGLIRAIWDYVGKGLLGVLTWSCGVPLLRTITTNRTRSQE